MEHKKDKDDAILTRSTKDHPKNFSHDSGHHKFIQWQKNHSESSVTMSNIKKKDI